MTDFMEAQKRNEKDIRLNPLSLSEMIKGDAKNLRGIALRQIASP